MMMTHTHIHTPMPTFDLTLHKHTHTSWCASFIALPGAFPLYTRTHTHTSSCVLEICLMMTHTFIPMPTLDCLHKHISPSRLQERFLCTHAALHQLAYVFHQCATSLLRRDGRSADCTVRHPGVKRPFSSYLWLRKEEINCFVEL